MEIQEVLTLSALSIFGLMTFVYLISLKIKDVSIIDVFWGLGFVLLARVLLSFNDSAFTLQYLVAVMVTIWGARLALHIGLRKMSDRKEDWRYARWRKDWGKNFWWMSYFRIFILQGVLMSIVSAPIWLSALQTSTEIHWTVWLGTSLWLIGFVFEAVGDAQLSMFVEAKRAGKVKKKIMTTGLWRYTRHPNYFGEISQWWGLFIVISTYSYGWVGIISPLLITYLLLKVSGISVIEDKYKNDKEFKAYKKRTSALIPMPPKE